MSQVNALEMDPAMIATPEVEGQSLEQAMLAQSETPVSPVDAVAENLEAGYIARTMDKVQTLGSTVVNAVRNNRKLAAGAVSVGLLAGGAAESVASTTEVEGTPQVTTTSKVIVNGATMSDKAMSKVTIGSYYKEHGLSKNQVKKIKLEGGRCYDRKVGSVFTNSLKRADGSKFYFKARVKEGDTRFCRTKSGHESKVSCGNDTFGPKPPERIVRKLVKGPVVAIKSWNKGSAKVVAKSKAYATARCETSPGNYASATGTGSGFAEARIKWANVNKAKGRNVVVTARGNASLKAVSEAKASAKVSCSEKGGTTTYTTPNEEKPAKDGTQTPPPPAEAPGKNPEPAKDEPYQGGYQCYDEQTGAPVAANSDTTCPSGSYGG